MTESFFVSGELMISLYRCVVGTVVLFVILARMGYAADAENRQSFKAIAGKESWNGHITRLWIIPVAEDIASKKLKTGVVPGVFLEMSGVHRLTGGLWEVVDLTLDSLRNYGNLRSIDLSFTEIRDADLVHLVKCPRLQSIALDFTKVTAVGVQHLRELHDLRYLSLVGVEVTDKDIADLQHSLPNLKIERRQLRGIDMVTPETWEPRASNKGLPCGSLSTVMQRAVALAEIPFVRFLSFGTVGDRFAYRYPA